MRQLLGLAVLWLAATPGTVFADFGGLVVGIHDGDTLTVRVSNSQVRVRLDGIDAPELSQAYGRRSKDSLASLCSAKQAQVAERGVDRYGRVIGRVSCEGVDVNAQQVRLGMAWVFRRYVRVNSPLYTSQAEAQVRKAGLWADANPVAPWDWRSTRR